MRTIYYFLFLLCAVVIIGYGCGTNSSNIKFKQYMSMGKLVYQKQCTNCHQDDGNGYEKLYPPLNGADFLLNNPSGSLCIIYQGRSLPLTVNGQEYNMKMPSFAHLKPDELAKVMTYITNAWDNDGGHLYTEEEVGKVLDECQ